MVHVKIFCSLNEISCFFNICRLEKCIHHSDCCCIRFVHLLFSKVVIPFIRLAFINQTKISYNFQFLKIKNSFSSTISFNPALNCQYLLINIFSSVFHFEEHQYHGRQNSRNISVKKILWPQTRVVLEKASQKK